jgi:hypothetical protein
MASTTRNVALKPMLAPGTYWCVLVAYHDGSAVRGIYGPYARKATAEDALTQLRAIGAYPDDDWKVMPLRLLDLGEATDE